MSACGPVAPAAVAPASTVTAHGEIQVQEGESIAAAVARAGPWQTIRLAPGRYKEEVVLGQDVHIVGPREAVLEWDGRFTLLCNTPTAPSVKGITIRNTSLLSESRAVMIRGGSQADVEGCDVSCAKGDGILVRGEETAPKLRGNAVHDCGGAGIVFYRSAKGVAEANDVFGNGKTGIEIQTGADPVVRGNKAHDGKQGGILVCDNGWGTVEGNDVFGNGKTGIAISTGADPFVRSNKVHDGKQGGILVCENGRGTVEGNDVYSNALAGIQISTGADPVVRGNKVHDGKQGGIFVWESGRGTVEGNDVYSNALAGIQISTSADPVVRGNKFHDGKQAGILVVENGRGTVDGNDVYGNALAGIQISTGADPVVRGNKFHDGKQAGILVVENGRGTVEGNDVYGNALAGIQISTSAGPLVKGNRAHRWGTLEGNNVCGNAGPAILIQDGGDPVISGNKIHDQHYGIFVLRAGHGTITGNMIERISDPIFGPAAGGLIVQNGCTPVVQGNSSDRVVLYPIVVHYGIGGRVSKSTGYSTKARHMLEISMVLAFEPLDAALKTR
eukprot:tig00000157_g9628.t1